MGEISPILYSLAFLFLIGILLPVIIEGFIDIPNEIEEGNYIKPFENFNNGLFNSLIWISDKISSPIDWLNKFWDTATFNIQDKILITGTGIDKYDGEYKAKWTTESTWTKSAFPYVLTFQYNEDTNQWALWRSSFLWFQTPLYTNSTGIINGEITLSRTEQGENIGVNPTATATFPIEETEEELLEDTGGFLENTRDYINEKLIIFSLIPSIIGIGLIILIFLPLLWGILKLIRG